MNDSNSPLSERAQLYLKNYKMLQELQNVFTEDWPGLMEFIEARINEMLNPESPEWTLQFQDGVRKDYHEVYKETWQQNAHLNVHFEYTFSQQSLEDGYFILTLHVESARTTIYRFCERLKQRCSELNPQFDAHGFNNRNRTWKELPSIPKLALAERRYTFTRDLSNIDAEFAAALKDYLFLVESIDLALKEDTHV